MRRDKDEDRILVNRGSDLSFDILYVYTFIKGNIPMAIKDNGNY